VKNLREEKINNLFQFPSRLIEAIKPLNNAIKRAFPWVDSGCNDCKHFKFNGQWGEWGGKIRYGTCSKGRIKKCLCYVGHAKELNHLVLAENQKKGLRRWRWLGKKVIAIPDYCVNMRCFEWRKK